MEHNFWSDLNSKSYFCKSIIFCLSISWSETTWQRHVVKVSIFELETESFDNKVWISARENVNSFSSSEISQVSMLSEMALKVLSVSMSLSTRTSGNSFLDKYYRRRRIWKQQKTLYKCFQIIRLFFLELKLTLYLREIFPLNKVFFSDSIDKTLFLLFDIFNNKSWNISLWVSFW